MPWKPATPSIRTASTKIETYDGLMYVLVVKTDKGERQYSPGAVCGANPYDKITSVTNVRHLTQFDNARALVLTSAGGGGFGPATGPFNLQTVALP